jgi:hypothetical protein
MHGDPVAGLCLRRHRAGGEGGNGEGESGGADHIWLLGGS